jgi:hypothetical protein
MNPIQIGMMTRVTLTLLVIPMTKYVMIDYRIVLYFILLFLDHVDSLLPLFMYGIRVGGEWEYQILDKIVDTLSYGYVLLLYSEQLDPLFRIALIYRMIGVILFIVTRQSFWLILFFDTVKEILLYRYLFEENNSYLVAMVILVILYEVGHKTINELQSKGRLRVF